MISFEPTEEQLLMRDSIAEFARTMLAPRVREFETARGLPDDVLKAAHDLGLSTLDLPESVGGQGLGLLTRVLLEEELGNVDAASAFALDPKGAFCRAVLELRSPEQKVPELSSFLSSEEVGAVAFSELKPLTDRPGFGTTATEVEDGFEIHGSKAFVTNGGRASTLLVIAQSNASSGWEGLSAFIVPKNTKGLHVVNRHETLGLNAVEFAQIQFDHVLVRRDAKLDAHGERLVSGLLRFFAKQGLVVAARALGVARSAYELASDYCAQRTAFGKPIGHFQAVAFALSDRLMDVESSRWMLWRAAEAWDSRAPEKTAIRLTASAVAHTLEAAMRAADDCVSLHGGSGFVRDVLAEKLMRDAKQLALACPTTEQFDQIATALELSLPLDPALVLPTPEAQAIFT